MTERESSVTLAEAIEFADKYANAKFARIGFEPVEDRTYGGTRAFRRTYASAREHFLVDLYAEGGDNASGTGLKIRHKGARYGGTFVWEFGEPPKVLGGSTSRRMLEERFDADFALFLNVLPQVRSEFGEQ